jgi:hypothetical protein
LITALGHLAAKIGPETEGDPPDPLRMLATARMHFEAETDNPEGSGAYGLCTPGQTLVFSVLRCQKESMAQRPDAETLPRKRWLRALRIAAILFKDEGYHTTYLDEVEAFIQRTNIQRTNAPQHAKGAPQPTAPADRRYRVDHYPHSRFWAVYDGEDLVAVTVYRKGAEAITARLEEKDRSIAALERQLAARPTTPGPLPAPAAEPVTDLVAGSPPPALLTVEAPTPYRLALPGRRPAPAPHHP